jgi:hypothetical protein
MLLLSWRSIAAQCKALALITITTKLHWWQGSGFASFTRVSDADLHQWHQCQQHAHQGDEVTALNHLCVLLGLRV